MKSSPVVHAYPKLYRLAVECFVTYVLFLMIFSSLCSRLVNIEPEILIEDYAFLTRMECDLDVGTAKELSQLFHCITVS